MKAQFTKNKVTADNKELEQLATNLFWRLKPTIPELNDLVINMSLDGKSVKEILINDTPLEEKRCSIILKDFGLTLKEKPKKKKKSNKDLSSLKSSTEKPPLTKKTSSSNLPK